MLPAAQDHRKEALSENAFLLPLLWNPHVSVWPFNSWHNRVLNNMSKLISISSTSSFIVDCLRPPLESTPLSGSLMNGTEDHF